MADTLVIVVTYNSAKWLDRCLGSVADSSHPADAIVIDNCSSDGTPDRVAAGWPQFRLVRNSENSGFGAANNIGFRYALENGYRYVYLLNSDAWLERDTLDVLINAFDAGTADGGLIAGRAGSGSGVGDCRWGILSPVQKDAAGNLDKNFEKKCGKYLRRAAGSGSAVGSVASSAAGEPVVVPFVMAAHWLMSSECVRRVGGFSPVFRQYGEDDNYIDRLRYHGLRCAVVPAASGVHDRASRELSKSARMKLKTVSSLVRVSNPARCFAISFCLEILTLLGMGVKNRSLTPWRYIPALISRRPELKSRHAQSRTPSAFLDLP